MTMGKLFQILGVLMKNECLNRYCIRLFHCYCTILVIVCYNWNVFILSPVRYASNESAIPDPSKPSSETTLQEVVSTTIW